MKCKKVLSLLLACAVTVSMGTTVFASTEDQIAAAQAQKQEAQAGLAQAQANIDGLESKKQELESYLAELNSQYTELTDSISQLSIEAAEKEEELKNVQAELEVAKQNAEEQYEAMKIRIKYMYENGGSTMLQTLLSADSISDFLNQANNVATISTYDRNMLKKYEETQEQIKTQEAQVEEESNSIGTLLTEKSSKQQEVQNLVASTNDNINSYVSQISASQEEANALMAEVNSADSSISQLMEQAEQEQAAAEAAAQEEAAAEASTDEAEEAGDYSEDSSEAQDTASDDTDYSEDSTYTEDTASTGSDYSEDTSSESTAEDTSSLADTSSSDSGSSSQGTYLGTFKLTGYCNCAQCCGTAGNATASGTTPTAGRTVAMAGVPFGTKLLINGNVYTVEDLGTPYGHVDIYCSSHSEALSFGLQYAEVYQLS